MTKITNQNRNDGKEKEWDYGALPVATLASTEERDPPKEWFAICVEAGMDPKELRKLNLMELYLAAGKVIHGRLPKQP